MSILKAVVLAAGEGSRMWPLATNRPKHLLPVGGQPLIVHTLQALRENSISEVFVVVGYKKELLRSALGNGEAYGLSITYVEQPQWTGTASALKGAFDALGQQPFLAVYGDLWLNSTAIRKVIEEARACSRVMGVVNVPNTTEYGVIELEGNRLVRILEKPQAAQMANGWVNTGIYMLDGEVFRAIKKTSISKRAEYELTSSLQQILDEGHEIRGAIVKGEDWLDVGRPWDLLEANERALAKLASRVRGKVEQGAVLKGPVWLEETALVKSGCYIEGPVYIGKDCSIGPNSIIRPHTSIQERVHIGASCEIKNSIIMNRTKIPHLSYVGDSIIGEECNLGAGTITANIRFDEQPLMMRLKGKLLTTGRKKLGVIMGDGVQTGINVSTFPGVRIGPGSWIGPGVAVSEDVQSGQLLLAKQTLTKKTMKRGKHIKTE